MHLAGFHPIVSRWFIEEVGEPTSAQRRGWESIQAGRHTLIAAPTGSGKTLAAFLTAIDSLFREGVDSELPDEVRVIYVSPLKALSADIHKNLAEPRRALRSRAEAAGIDVPRITAAVRTGDTTASERAAMVRTPPHILVTTPESLYLLVTAERSREMLRTVRTVIVDEIHAPTYNASACRPRRSRSTRSPASWSATIPRVASASLSTKVIAAPWTSRWKCRSRRCRQ
jgi:ATP-dependent helicase Lhr and Lhr-like helicase